MSGCPVWERLSASEEWTQAEREHVALCARCASFVAEYRAFLAGDPALPAGERADAERRLSEFIDGHVNAPAPVGAPRVRRSAGAIARFAAWFASPPVRWAASFAALALVASIAVVTRQSGVRVGEAQRGVASAEFRADVARLAGGAVRVTWGAASNADGYRIELLSADLAVLATDEVTASREWQFVPAEHPGAVYVRVVALRLGDRVLETSLAPVPTP